MPRAILNNWLLFLVLIGSIVVSGCGSGDEPEEVTFDLRIADRAIAGFDSAVEVKQYDDVTFNITSDEAASFHLHGYDHELELTPQVTGSVSFTADATGSFPITIHVGAESGGMDHHDLTIDTPSGMSVGVEAKLDGTSAVNLKITTAEFTFAPESVNGPHVDGEGHAHVYVDGVKINRIYGPYYHLVGLSPRGTLYPHYPQRQQPRAVRQGRASHRGDDNHSDPRRACSSFRPPRKSAVGVEIDRNRPRPPNCAAKMMRPIVPLEEW